MAFAYFEFSFYYLNLDGKPRSRFHKKGIVMSEGLKLEEAILHFENIHKISREEGQLAITLYPAIATSRAIAENIFPNTTSFVIQIPDDTAFEVKSLVDQRYTKWQTDRRRKQLALENKSNHFHSQTCPRCSSIVDLTGKPKTAMTYCPYCYVFFNQHGHVASNTSDYKICPKCRYFGRVSTYYDTAFYLYKNNKKKKFETVRCCETCARELFEEDFWKSLPFVIGAAPLLYDLYKAGIDRNPIFKGLAEANYQAHKYDVDKVRELFDIMLLRTGEHAGIYYNYGKAFLEASKALVRGGKSPFHPDVVPLRQKAIRELTRSLLLCSNYEPTIRLLQDNGEIEFVPQEVYEIDI
ncbi:MAG: hypothetical protein JJT94_07790 [Bernardetiaceae bacterium]|nr:hypothetical protein [Bernardetiaceae bacterium]